MKTLTLILSLVTIIGIMTSCTVTKVNEAAKNDRAQAQIAMQQIKKHGLVAIFPTEYKKERALRKMAKSNSSLKEDIKELQEKRAERLNIWRAEMSNYTFSDISIVPDSLLKKYIEDPSKFSSFDENGNIRKSSFGDIYVLYTEYGGFQVKREGEYIPNPFPNWKRPSKWAAIRDFVGVQGEEKSINSFFEELDRSFHLYDSYRSSTEGLVE